jgi:hypothetical protein
VSNAAVHTDLGSLAEGASATVIFTGQPASLGLANVDFELTGRAEDNSFMWFPGFSAFGLRISFGSRISG